MYEMMKDNFYNFITQYKDFYSGQKEDITSFCTQPFWQSLMYSKKRLDENGLTMEINYLDEKEGKKRGSFYKTETMNTKRIDTQIYPKRSTYKAGFAKKRLTVSKKILKGNSCIYEENADMMVCTDQIMKDGEDVYENASTYTECPNCGHRDTISAFISGCSHCNSKFIVQENALKISSFYMKNDYEKGISRKFGRMAKIATLVMILSAIFALPLFVCSLILDMFFENVSVIRNAIGTGLFISSTILFLAVAFWLCLIFVNIIRWIYYDNHMFARINYSPFTREIREKIKDFSSEVFAQNLEMILRNIHMTNRPADVNAFARIDMSEVVNSYNDVIDCSLSDISFVDFKELDNEYVLIADVGMNVLRYKDGMVYKQYEGITLTLTGAKDMVVDNLSVISMYECEFCGSTVNLLNGGVCEYCESKIPYEKYNFIIENYRIKEKAMPDESKIRRKLVITFGVLYTLAAGLVLKLMMGRL